MYFKKNDTNCTRDIHIANDNITGHDETCLLHLTLYSPMDESDTILLSPNVAEVMIKDDDSKITCLHQCFAFN